MQLPAEINESQQKAEPWHLGTQPRELVNLKEFSYLMRTLPIPTKVAHGISTHGIPLSLHNVI
jgi:hypothetical protein